MCGVGFRGFEIAASEDDRPANFNLELDYVSITQL